MKLYKYLNEEMHPGSIVDTLKMFCNNYLNEIKGEFLWRGTKRIVKDIGKFSNRLEDRKPRNTDPGLHKRLNSEFKKKFGWFVRNGVFVTPNERDANYYGFDNSSMFFPMGNYKYCYSPIFKDLTTDIPASVKSWIYDKDVIIKRSWYYYSLENNLEKGSDEYYKWLANFIKEAEEKINDIIKNGIVGTYRDKGLSNIIGKRYEISFNCKDYYLVHWKHIEYLKESLWK